ncbi:hypothetical protein CCP2SC5_440023 [Azospirillaceae bacterium]
MIYGCEVGGCVIGVDPTFVIAESHIQNSVETVLDGPVTSDNRTTNVGVPCLL